MNRLGAAIAAVVELVALAATSLAIGLAGLAVVAAEPRPQVLATLAAARRLAASGNGQVIFCLEGVRGAIVAIDPEGDGEVREVVAAPDAGGFRPVAIAALDTTVLAAVCRGGDEWELRTWRLKPDSVASADRPLQRIPLGTAGGDDGRVDLAVGSGRNWLAVAGLPPPLAALLRAPLARVQVGPLSTRSCPQLSSGTAAQALAAGPLDEMVLVLAGPDGGAMVAYHDQDGRPLLSLDTGLERILDAAFAPNGRSLWVVGQEAGGRSGLWRLEATLRGGRQAIRPVLILPLDGPLAVVAPTERSVVVCREAGAGETAAPIERYDLPPSAPAAVEEGGAADERQGR